MSRIAQLEEFYRSVWINGDTASLARFFTPDARIEGVMPGFALMPVDFVTCVQAMLAVVTEPRITVLQVVEEADRLAALVRSECLSIMDGREISFDTQVMMRFEGDRIVHAFNTVDTAHLMMQLGMLPPDAIERMMTGRTS